MTYHNDLPPRPTTTTITSQLDEANAARETAVSNLQKSRQEGSGLARQYATLAEEHARLQASAQEAAHATAQLEERLRAAQDEKRKEMEELREAAADEASELEARLATSFFRRTARPYEIPPALNASIPPDSKHLQIR